MIKLTNLQTSKLQTSPVVRMAPSPSGNLHIGTARTALYNYLFARQAGGKFIMRIEDTDKERSKKKFEDNILQGLEWLGLRHDELYRQSERGDVYSRYIRKMIDSGSAYVSREEGGDRDEVIRFKNPNKKVVFDDLVRGKVEFDTSDLGDFVVAKSPEEPLYHLAVVADDHEMGVTHVIRGEDHISNTPRQILIQEAIGARRPIYAHIPLILAADRKKLSKRVHGEAVWIDTYKEKGFLPEALTNYMALLGWNPGGEKEIFTLEELEVEFGLGKVHKGGAVFDEAKLRWVNKEHIKLRSLEVKKLVSQKIQEKYDTEPHPKLVETVFERIETLGDIDTMTDAGELDYFFTRPAIDEEKIVWKNSTKLKARENLERVAEILESEEDIEKLKEKIMSLAEEAGKGDVLWPLRYALCGREKSPDPFTLLSMLGPAESASRVRGAIKLL